MNDLALFCAVAILSVCVAVLVTLIYLLVHFRIRNRMLAANTEMLDAIGDVLIALYPDHNHPDIPSLSHKFYATQRLQQAKAAVACNLVEFRKNQPSAATR